MAFVAADYWDVTGTFASETGQFTAKITTVDGARVATGSDFTDDGALKSRAKSATVLTQESAATLVEALTDAPAEVTRLESKIGRASCRERGSISGVAGGKQRH